ncbi:MAG: hypothetical protein R6W78_12235 [Bacteroidales bacterium]
MAIFIVPLLMTLLSAGVIFALIYLIAKRIESKRKETFEKRDY